jgi:hypothetical protein
VSVVIPVTCPFVNVNSLIAVKDAAEPVGDAVSAGVTAL